MATAGQLARIGGLERLILAVLWLGIAISGLVMWEPAPYDMVMVLLIGGCVVAGLRVPRGLSVLFVLLSISIAGAAFGSAQAAVIDKATINTLVTLFLAASAIFIASIVAWDPSRAMPVVVSAYTIAAVLTAITALVGYFALLPGAADLFTLYGRAKGTFKDPNVMGPFLIFPIIVGIHRLVTRPLARVWYWPAILGVLLAGLFLSFSRGAWAHLVISVVVYVGLFLLTSRSNRARTRLIAMCILAGLLLALGLAWLLSLNQVSTLFTERATLGQAYDLGAQGRFAGQRLALGLITTKPFGIGATQFIFYNPDQVHNVYLNMFLLAGWAGGFAYLTLVLVTLAKGFGFALKQGGNGLYLAVYATFVGVAMEGVIIDTDHWRHFYLLLGLVWGLMMWGRANGGRTNFAAGHENSLAPLGEGR